MKAGDNELTAPIGQVLISLKSLRNFDELYQDKNFQEWLRTTFGWGLLGFDNADAYELVKNRTGHLTAIKGDSYKEIIRKLVNLELVHSSEAIVGATIPSECGLAVANSLQGLLAYVFDEDATILFQASNHETNNIELYIMTLR